MTAMDHIYMGQWFNGNHWKYQLKSAFVNGDSLGWFFVLQGEYEV